MHDWQSLAHVRWECKYHVVIIRSFGGRFCTASCASKSDGFCGRYATSGASSCSKGRRWRTTCISPEHSPEVQRCVTRSAS